MFHFYEIWVMVLNILLQLYGPIHKDSIPAYAFGTYPFGLRGAGARILFIFAICALLFDAVKYTRDSCEDTRTHAAVYEAGLIGCRCFVGRK